MGIILSLATLYFFSMREKSQIESQTRQLYADLMGARTQALYQKLDRTVTISANQYSITPWNEDGSSVTVLQRTISQPLTVTPAGTITFDARGMANATVGICVHPNGNPGAVDSVLVYPTSIAIGKRNSGGGCVSSQIKLQ